MDLGLARSVPSPRPGPRLLIIYLPVPSSAVTLSRRPVVDMIWPPAAGGMLRPVPSSRLFLDRPSQASGRHMVITRTNTAALHATTTTDRTRAYDSN